MDGSGSVPKIRVYWDAFESTALCDFQLSMRMLMLIKLAFYSGAMATITFRRIVNGEVPENAKRVVLLEFLDDVEQGIRSAGSYVREVVGFRKLVAEGEHEPWKKQKKSKPQKPPRFSAKAELTITKDGKVKANNVDF